MGVLELAAKMCVDKSVAHRILATLTSKGFARRIPESRRYGLGAEAARVGYAYVKSHDVRQILLPVLQRLADQTGETVTLAVYDSGSALVVERVEGMDRVRTVSEVGTRGPVHAGASCKALLAFQPFEEVERVIREIGLPKLTPYTITDPAVLREDLLEIRRCGYSLSLGEVRIDQIGIGAPVFNYRGQVAAAISVAGPSSRLTPERRQVLVARLLDTAREGSRLLGYVPVASLAY